MLTSRAPVAKVRLSTRRLASHILANTSAARKYGERWGVRHYQGTLPRANSPCNKSNLIRTHGAPISRRAQALLGERDDTVEDDGERDEWDTITALEASRKKQDWREELADNETWEFESDLDRAQEDQQIRLVHLHSSDLELWEELFLFRLNHHGSDGGKMIWKHLDKAVSAQPMRIWERPRLWRPLFELALKDSQMLNDLIYHCSQVATVFKDYPDAFYLDVMKHALLGSTTADVLALHASMMSFPPLKSELVTLFNATAGDQELLKVFQMFCFELPAFSGMYKHIVPKLVYSDMLTQALEWHELLIKHRDLPANFDLVKEALRRLRKDGHTHLAQKMAWQLHTAGVPGGRSWLQLRDPIFAESTANAKASPEELPTGDFQLGAIPAKQFSDAFVSRLFATSFFSIETVLAGLSAINVTQIGPLAFRQLLFRLAGPASDRGADTAPIFNTWQVERAQKVLDQAGMELKPSTFSDVVLRLAQEKNNVVLQDLLESDQHPDVLDDLDLQETLLSRYVERGSNNDINRTLAILRITKGESYSTARKGDVANMQLLLAIDRKDKNLALIILREITQSHQNLEYHALTGLLYGLMFSPRAMGLRPKEYKELDEVTQFMMNLQRYGYPVPQRAWQELIRRRFWEADLSKIKTLLEWKLNWIIDAKFRQAQTFSDARPLKWKSYYHNWSANMMNKNTYLEALFNKHVQTQLVWVGFSKDMRHRGSVLGSARSPLLPGSADERSKFLANDTCLWGLRLLKLLHDNGLKIDTKRIRQVCLAPLAVLFGPAIPSSNLLRRTQMLRRANWTDYASAMEHVWDSQIFLPSFIGRASPSELDSLTRLREHCRWTLRRSTLRMRLRIDHQVRTHKAGKQAIWYAGGRHSWQAYQDNYTRDLRAWHQSLPIVDTDSYLQTLLPEINPTGKLENDPLDALSQADRLQLMRNSWRGRLGENPLEGFSAMSQYDTDRQAAQTWSSLHGRKRVWWQRKLLKTKSNDWHAEIEDHSLEHQEQQYVEGDDDQTAIGDEELDMQEVNR